MASDVQSDFQDFQRFVGSKLSVGEPPVSLEQALDEFRAYQRDLAKFQADTRQSLEESARGESSALDIDSVLERGRERMAQKGMAD